MSLCTIVLNKHVGFIGADTRVCSIKGKEILGDYPKLQNINDKYLIFGSGRQSVCTDVFEKLRHSNTSNIDEIQNIIKETVAYYYNKLSAEDIADLPRENRNVKEKGKIIFQTFVIMMMNEGVPTVYQIVNCDDVHILTNPTENISWGCAGAHTAKAQEILSQNLENAVSGNAYEVIASSMQNEYNCMANNEIGGNLHIYEVSKKGIRLIYNNPIEDLYLNGHCKIYDGYIHMTRPDKTSKVNITPDEFTIYRGNGSGAYEKSVYIDANGNAVFSGIVSGSDIIGSDFYNKGQTVKLTLGMNGNLGDLKLTRTADDTVVFQVYDDITVTTLRRNDIGFISTSGSNTYMLGKWLYKDKEIATQQNIKELEDRIKTLETRLQNLETSNVE